MNDNEVGTELETEEPSIYETDEEKESGLFRWMSAFVVVLAMAGFFGLAWYAYKSGGSNVDENDVEIIHADNTPVKEAPANPGGMQIPNQDKTVYGLINGGKTEKPVAERLLPAPEEPIARGSDTETWMSDKLKNKTQDTNAADASADTAPVTSQPDTAKVEQFNPAKNRLALENSQPAVSVEPKAIATPDETSATTPASETVAQNTSSAPKPDTAVPSPLPAAAPQAAPAQAPAKTAADTATNPPIQTTQSTQPAAPEAVPAKPIPAKTPVVSSDSDQSDDDATPATPTKPAPKPTPVKSGKITRVQLGAYKSENEAKQNWARIKKEFPDELQDREYFVVRVDLGSKGIFYRLQVGAFASSHDAEQFCMSFVSSGQGCIAARAM